ncbi:MAG: hypothetical protein HY913_06830 [Desulfomonile tiedjei]|nr:hypothetical protein [Desulfomonile tiedjei]
MRRIKVIDRTLIGKKYPAFAVALSVAFQRQLWELFQSISSITRPSGPSANWPAILTLHGTACLMAVWEDMGVDPLDARLIKEDFAYFRDPEADEELTGQVHVEEITQSVESDSGIEEQVDLLIDFRDRSNKPVANYRSSYRIPLATPR